MVSFTPLRDEEHGTVLGLQVEHDHRQQQHPQRHVRVHRVRLQVLQISGAAPVIEENKEARQDEVDGEVEIHFVHLLFQIEYDLRQQDGPQHQYQHEVEFEIQVIDDEVEERQHIEAHLEEVELAAIVGIVDIDVLEAVLDAPHKEQDAHRQNDRQEREAEEQKEVVVEQLDVADGWSVYRGTGSSASGRSQATRPFAESAPRSDWRPGCSR